MKHIDPKIKVTDALKHVGSNQSKLAEMLSIERSSVNEWVKSEREFLPPLQAYRFEKIVNAGSK